MNHNLTNFNRVAILCVPCSSKVGRENPFRYGEKLPLFSVVFLCPSFHTTLVRVVSVMTGLLGQSSRLVAPYRGILTPFNSVAHTVRSIGFGYSSQDMEPPMIKNITAQIEQTQTPIKQKTTD